MPRRDGLAVLHAPTQGSVREAPLPAGRCARHARSARTFLKYMVKSVVPNSPDFSTVMSMRGAASLLMAARLTRTAPPICML